MNSLTKILDRTATRIGLVVLIALYAIVFGMIIFTMSQLSEATSGAGIIDFERGYSASRVGEILGSYGPDGFALYGRIQLLDLINPALYSLIFASILHLMFRGGKASWVVILPLIAGMLDYLENVTIFLLIRSFPTISDGLVWASSTLSIAKNIALPAAVLALLVGIVLAIRARLLRKN